MSKALLVSSGTISHTTGLTKFCAIGQTGDNGSSEVQSLITWTTAGVFSGMNIRVISNAATGAGTFTFRKNLANGNQTVAVTAATTGEFRDTTHQDLVVVGDTVNYQFTSGTGGTTVVTTKSVLFSAPGAQGLERLSMISAASYNPNGATVFAALVEDDSNAPFTVTEANCQFKIKTTGVLQSLQVHIGGNSRTTTTTFGTRINGVNGNSVISVLAAGTGVFQDQTHQDSVVSGNLVNYYITFGADANNLFIQLISCEYMDSVKGQYYFINSNSNNAPVINSNTTFYYHPSGKLFRSFTESDTQVLTQFAQTVSNLECFISANTSTVGDTVKRRKNGANGNQSISITALTTGYFEDAVNTDSIISTDEINYQVSLAVGGTSMTVRNIGMLSTGTATPTEPGTDLHLLPILGVGR